MPKGGVLSSAIKAKSEPVPLPWSVLAPIVQPRPGFLVIILGAPGVGKSTVGIQYAYSLSRPSLILSLDTDLASQAVRVRAMLEDRPTTEVQRDIEDHPERWDRFFSQDLPLVRWSDAPMVAADLDEMLEAEKEFLGETPALVVVDVLADIAETEELTSYLEAFKTLHRLARKHKTVVVVLHHLKRGEAASGSVKFGLSEGLFGGERVAEIVLGMWQPQQNTVMVSVLKNRMGPADRNGDYSFGMQADLSRARIGSAGLEGYTVGNLRSR